MPREPVAEIIAYHGWGYDRHFWRAWPALLAQQNVAFNGFDRGYFGHPCQPTFTYPQSCKIIFAHSYGLHLCPSQQLRIADIIVVFASFVNFHAEERKAKRRSQRILKQMIEQFQVDPESVLQAFWKNCGTPTPAVDLIPHNSTEDQQLSLLLHDLQDLGQSLLCVDFLARRPKIILLQGNQDRIVHPERGQTLAQALAPNASLFCLDGPHSLPATDPQRCWELLRSHLLAF